MSIWGTFMAVSIAGILINVSYNRGREHAISNAPAYIAAKQEAARRSEQFEIELSDMRDPHEKVCEEIFLAVEGRLILDRYESDNARNEAYEASERMR